MKPVVLIGLPGAGKTTFGIALARRRGLAFVDTDQEIERATGLSVAQIFRDHGEAHFRQLERELSATFVQRQHCVIALGGGGFEDGETRRTLLALCRVIWLDPSHETLLARLRDAPPRPLFANRHHGRVLADLATVRRPAYAQAHLRVTETRLGPAIASIEAFLLEPEAKPCGR